MRNKKSPWPLPVLQENIRHTELAFFPKYFLSLAAKYLTILFNLYTTVPTGAEEAGKLQASCFKISDTELANTVFDRPLEMLRINGLSVAEGRDSAEKHVFQAEVNRMMKLIINSLYKQQGSP